MDGPAGTEKIVYSAATGAFFGTAVGSVESVWSIPKLGAQLPKFATQVKHIGARALILGTAGGLFATAEYTAESIRQTSDPINAAIGGAAAGIVPGILSKNARIAFGSSLVAGVAMAAASFWSESSVSPFEKYAAAREAERS